MLPLLNGLDHIACCASASPPETVLAGSIRVEADRPQPGVVVHTSPFLLVSMASAEPAARRAMQALADALVAGGGARARCSDSEAQVMWSKLVRLNALACTTSAYDKLLGEIRSTPELRADLVGAIEEACAVGQGGGRARRRPGDARSPSSSARTTRSAARCSATSPPGARPSWTRSRARCCAPARATASRCPTIERLVAMIAARAGVPRRSAP